MKSWCVYVCVFMFNALKKKTMQDMHRTPFLAFINYIYLTIYLMDIEVKGALTSQFWDHLSIRKSNEHNWLKYID